jgi:hypothetical protein
VNREAGEPQLVPVASVRGFPEAAAVSCIAATREVPDTTAEYDNLCWLVRVYADDRVEVGQTRGQMWEQARLVGQGFTVGEVDDQGDYRPVGFNPDTGRWQPIGPGDEVIEADMTRTEDGWQWTGGD